MIAELGDPARELAAALEGCAVTDRSDLTRLIATGPDFLALLQRLGTGDVQELRPGQGRLTVLTSPKGRIVELLFLHHLGPEGILAVAGPGAADRVLAHIAKYTFAETIGLADVTGTTFAASVCGPRWADAAAAAGFPDLAPYAAAPFTLAGARVHVVRTNAYDDEGVLVVGARADAHAVGAALVAAVRAAGGDAIGPRAREAWRVLRGLPASGSELNDEHNPLEAGLRDAVSFTKGCYVGQEVVARLKTYDKVARTLVLLRLRPGAAVPAGGSAVWCGGREAGRVTSAVLPPGQDAPAALAYAKLRDLPDDAAWEIEAEGTRLPAERVTR